MKMLKVWFVLALVFFAGFAGGVVTTRVTVRRVMAKAVSQPDWVQMRIERELFRQLRLNPKQRQEVHVILVDARGQMRTLRREFQPQFTSIVDDTRGKISAVLDPQQQKRFERLQAEHRLLL